MKNNRLARLILLIGIIIALLLPTTVLAAEAVATGETLSAKAGDTITFSVNLSGNPGLAAWMFHLTWDESVLQYVPDSVEAGEGFTSGAMLENAEAGKLAVSWYNTKDVADNGTVFTAQFTVLDDAYSDDYEIGVDCSAPNTINSAEQQVPITATNGTVTVKGTDKPEQTPPSGGEDKKVPEYNHGLTLDYNEVTLAPNSSKQLAVAEEKEELLWHSSDDSVVKVENGKLKAIGPGSTTVTVTTPDGQEQSTCVVTVSEGNQGSPWIIGGALAVAVIVITVILTAKRRKSATEGKRL